MAGTSVVDPRPVGARTVHSSRPGPFASSRQPEPHTVVVAVVAGRSHHPVGRQRLFRLAPSPIRAPRVRQRCRTRTPGCGWSDDDVGVRPSVSHHRRRCRRRLWVQYGHRNIRIYSLCTKWDVLHVRVCIPERQTSAARLMVIWNGRVQKR